MTNNELYIYSYLNKSRVVTTGANFIFTDAKSSVSLLLDSFKHLQNLEISLYSNSGKKITLKHVIMSSELAEINLAEDDFRHWTISSPDLLPASSSRHQGTKLRIRKNVMTFVINCIKPLGT